MRKQILVLLSFLFLSPLTGALAADSTITIDEDTSYRFEETDFEFNVADGQTLVSIKITSLVTEGTLKLNGTDIALDDVITVANISNLVFTPTPNAFGQGYDSFQYLVNDELDNSTQYNTITIDVTNVNDAPIIAGAPPTSIDQGNHYHFKPTASDIDTTDTLIFSIANIPLWASFDTTTGTLSGIPTDADADVGLYKNIVITVTDSNAAATEESPHQSLSDSLEPFSITVNDINDAPLFSNRPATSVDEDASYRFVPAVVDIDDSENNPAELTYSITNTPVWAVFDYDTGTLSNKPLRPNNKDVGIYNNIVITVTDSGTPGPAPLTTRLPPFSITVNNSNDAPTGDVTIAGNFEEDQTLTASNNLQDEDGLGLIRYQWKRSGVNVGINSDRYLLGDADVGHAIHAITVSASYTDKRGTDETVSSTSTDDTLIKNINDPRTGTITISGDLFVDSTLTAIPDISDDDGLGALSYQWKRSGQNVGGNSNTYTLTSLDFDHTMSVSISYLDGHGTTEGMSSAETAVVINNPTPDNDRDGEPDATDTDDDDDGMPDDFETAHGLNPKDGADALDDLDGDGESNLTEFINKTDPTKDDYPPEDIVIPADIQVNASGLLTAIDLGHATAVDSKDGDITPRADTTGPFFPGSHTITWTATDAAGNSATATTTQTVNVVPLVNFTVDQISGNNSVVTVTAQLNGVAPTYPVTIPFTVSGTATSHDLSDRELTINAASSEPGSESDGVTGTVTINIAEATEGETITLTMGRPAGAVPGNKTRHTITITEQNVAPQVSLDISQDGEPATLTIIANKGPVVVTATVSDPNPSDTHAFVWNASALIDKNDDLEANTFTFDTDNLVTGRYTLSVEVTDSGEADVTRKIVFRVIATAPTRDSDGDGIDDTTEDYRDSDGDGIANYLDAITLKHVVAQQQTNQSLYLVETDPGLALRLGAIAFAAATNGLQVTAATIEKFAGIRTPLDDHVSVGGLFDFEIHGLAKAGHTAQIVIPLRSAIPPNPRYRKMMPTGWQDFIVDGKNALASAAGSDGNCPPPGDNAYSIGLTTGHKCLQLLLEDGGPNDADGVADGVITDPGSVAVKPVAVEETPPEAEPPLVDIGGGALHTTLLLLLMGAGWRLYGRTKGATDF